METAFDSLNDYSRVWVYASHIELSDNQIAKITDKLNLALKDWNSHGQNLKSSFLILENRFVIISVEEDEMAKASGCAIDKSTHWMKDIANDLGLDFFQNNLVYFKNTNQKTESVDFRSVSELLNNKRISADTIFINTQIKVKDQLKTEWFLPLKSTWLKKYLV